MSTPANFQPQIPSTVKGPWIHKFIPPSASTMSCFNSSTHTCGCGSVKSTVKGPILSWPRVTIGKGPFCGTHPCGPYSGGCGCEFLRGNCQGIQQLGNQGGPIIINNGPVATSGHLQQGQGCAHGGIASASIFNLHLDHP